MGRRHRTEAQAARAERKQAAVDERDRIAALATRLEIDGQHVKPPLILTCPECGAEPGRRCTNGSGTPRKEPHRARADTLDRDRDAQALWEAHWQWCRDHRFGLEITML